jgi:hypothetical protein
LSREDARLHLELRVHRVPRLVTKKVLSSHSSLLSVDLVAGTDAGASNDIQASSLGAVSGGGFRAVAWLSQSPYFEHSL